MSNIVKAINDYHKARRRATLEQVASRFTGKSTDLLSFEEVRRRVRANQQIERGLQDVPLDLIVGSVGRYKDFTRTFLPKESTNEYRWANVKSLNLDTTGLPPIELYKIGDAYFVIDGNHRVSVAREMGWPSIQAYVTEFLTRVPVGPDTDLDDLIIAEEYTEFLERTELDQLRPDLSFEMTAPGRYHVLLEHIEAHRYFMGVDFSRDISWEEAVTHWADTIYKPVVELIRERGIMNDFPNRTPTDLYVWIADHQAELEEQLGWDLATWETVEAFSQTERSGVKQLSQNIWAALAEAESDVMDEQIAGAAEAISQNRFFSDILVSLGERQAGWAALDQALLIAQREEGRLRAVHHTPISGPVSAADEHHDHLPHHYFEEKLRTYAVSGRIADVSGDWVRAMSERARWVDLIVMSINQEPGGTALTSLSPDWQQIFSNVRQPMLIVPRQPSTLSKALVAYTGFPKSKIGLTIGAYLAIRWGISLVVTSIGKPKQTAVQLQEAENFLAAFGLSADFVAVEGRVETNLLVTQETHGCDFLIMGGPRSNPLLNMFLGGVVQHILRHSRLPVLICQ